MTNSRSEIMGLQLKNELYSVLNETLYKEILSENERKIKEYQRIKNQKNVDYSWIIDDQLILDLILLSVFYIRVIDPMEETIRFYNRINYKSPDRERDRIRIKIQIGNMKIGQEIEREKNVIDIDQLQKIIENFHTVLRIMNISPRFFTYKSIDEFLRNLKTAIGVLK
jgi:hypothetical protein